MTDPRTDAAAAVAVYREAARENRECALRTGSMLDFPNYGQLVMTGDLHGHRRNLERLITYCDLGRAGARHVVLHELIHEDVDLASEVDKSHEPLLEAALWKCEFPDQVHFVMGNHELAQITGREISKAGRILTTDFDHGVERTYGATGAAEVVSAINEFLCSFALAGRTANRVFLSHSLPGARDVATFDPAVLRREPRGEDLVEGGSVYALVWGRRQSDQVLSQLAEMLDVDLFVCGHQPQETGYHVVDNRLLIIASDHNHGVFVPFDLSRKLEMADLLRAMRPLASIA